MVPCPVEGDMDFRLVSRGTRHIVYWGVRARHGANSRILLFLAYQGKFDYFARRMS